MHLDELAVAAGDELKSLRVLPLLFHTISVSDGIAMGTEGMRASLPSRDWIADSVELVVHAERMDGLMTIAGCDKTLPGDDDGDDQARPAVGLRLRRLDQARLLPGPDVTIQDVYEGIGAHSTGKMCLEDLTELECVALPGKGSCASMYTANTMASVSEALGLTVARHGVPGCRRPGARADRSPRGRGARRCARERSPSVGHPHEDVVRECDRRRRGARRLDERVSPPSRLSQARRGSSSASPTSTGSRAGRRRSSRCAPPAGT